jgi:nicotinamidase-related amidase
LLQGDILSAMPEHPPINDDLHGNAPDTCPVALLLIDVINDLEFDSGGELLVHALPAAKRMAELKQRARALGIPAVYVNDNFGRWRSDFKALVQHCSNSDVRGRPIARLLTPAGDDYFVLKPKHSGFYSTTLEILLQYLQTTTLIICGLTGDMCVLFTANDAFLRDYRLVVPSDCVASRNEEDNRNALTHMHRILEADTAESVNLDLRSLLSG